MKNLPCLGLIVFLLAGLCLPGEVPVRAAPLSCAGIFFSEYIEGSGFNKAVEIYNGTGTPVDLGAEAYTLEVYFNGAAVPGSIIHLSGMLFNQDVFAIAHTSADAAVLALVDQKSGSLSFNGNDALVLKRAGLVLDRFGQVGLDPGSAWGTGMTSSLDHTLRRKAGVASGDPNAAVSFDPALEWDGFPRDDFSGFGAHAPTCAPNLPPAVYQTFPADGAVNISLDAALTVSFNQPVVLQPAWFHLDCAGGELLYAYTPSSGSSASYTLDPSVDLPQAAACQARVDSSKVPGLLSDVSWTFTTVSGPGAVRIDQIQAAGHASPLNNTPVSAVPGVVTGVTSQGFYLQDPLPDQDPATSEGLFVYLNAPPPVQAGDSVLVSGLVQEYRSPSDPSGLRLTEIAASGANVSRITSGNPLPPPVVIGIGGRMPAGHTIEDDGFGEFDPARDWIDFYESLEGMRVQLNLAQAVGPTDAYGETPVVPDAGASSVLLTPRGGVLLQADQANPERLTLDNAIQSLPALRVGASFEQVIGVIDYSSGSFKLEVTHTQNLLDSTLQPETSLLAAGVETSLTIAAFNTENLDTGDPPAHFNRIAAQIVQNLNAPDIVCLEEVQDNSGPANDGVVFADQTLAQLSAAIQAAGGPLYAARQINPQNNQDGGQVGGNIRQVFLFNPARVAFVDRSPGDALTPTQIQVISGGPVLSHSPGRIDPANPAFHNSRKPLAGEFLYRGARLFVIANHFVSKIGDDPLFGNIQPPVLSSEPGRVEQAAVVHSFVDSLLALDPHARVVVLGDLNDFAYSAALLTLQGSQPQILFDLVETLPAAERYTYIYEGNSQALDHILVSPGLKASADIVHLNAELPASDPLRTSDHDPFLARLENFYGAYLPLVRR